MTTNHQGPTPTPSPEEDSLLDERHQLARVLTRAHRRCLALQSELARARAIAGQISARLGGAQREYEDADRDLALLDGRIREVRTRQSAPSPSALDTSAAIRRRVRAALRDAGLTPDAIRGIMDAQAAAAQAATDERTKTQ